MIHTLQPEFVDSIPKVLDDGKLYISKKYATAVHKCCCGCGQKVVTPLRPTDWKLRVEGSRVSLWPSIGNWSFPCRSHYWIVNNQVEWSYDMSQEDIDAGRLQDARRKDRFIRTGTTDPPTEQHAADTGSAEHEESFWVKIKRWLFG
mgnify:CR=1 FL=1